MTEEPKKRSNSIFYWLGGFIVFGLLAIGGMYLYIKNKHFASDEHHVNHTTAGKIAMAIDEYDRWVDALPERRMNVDHELISNGFTKIASVLSLMADSSTTREKGRARADIETIKLMADSITVNWKSGRHADMITKAFDKTADCILILSKTRNDDFDNERNNLLEKVKAINDETLTLNQRDEVKAAFKQTANVLKKAGWTP